MNGKYRLRQVQHGRTAAGPTTGAWILDLSRLVAGNMLTHILADFGAMVMKVERPGVGGDPRQWRVRARCLAGGQPAA